MSWYVFCNRCSSSWYQSYVLLALSKVEKAKGREADAKKVEFMTPEEKEKQKRLGGVVAEFKAARYMLGDRVLLKDFTYNFRQRDRIGVVGPNG